MITQDGKIFIFSGKTRSGKTAKAVLLEKALKKPFVIAWDPDAQWCDLPGFKKNHFNCAVTGNCEGREAWPLCFCL